MSGTVGALMGSTFTPEGPPQAAVPGGGAPGRQNKRGKLKKLKAARGDVWTDGKLFYLDELGAGQSFESQDAAEKAAADQEAAAKKGKG